jgi:hypothetical protein
MIPTLLFWENKNTWYGSKGLARFFIKPITVEQEGCPPESRLEVELWRGPLTKALSEILTTATFPVSEEGLAEMTAWLEDQAAVLNGTK